MKEKKNEVGFNFFFFCLDEGDRSPMEQRTRPKGCMRQRPEREEKRREKAKQRREKKRGEGKREKRRDRQKRDRQNVFQ